MLIAPGDNHVTLTDATSFACDQWITIAGVAGVFQITALAPLIGLSRVATLLQNVDPGAPAGQAINVVMVASTTNGVATFSVDDATGLLVGQRITIAGITNGPLRITAIHGTMVASDPAPNSTGSLRVVAFSPAKFTLFGTIHTRGEGAGQLSLDMGDADQSLTAEQAYGATTIKVVSTSAFTANHKLSFPAPTGDEDAYQRTVRSMVGGGFTLIVDVIGGGGGVPIPTGQTAIVGFDSGGAYLVTQA